jgi:hypothetical protein
MPGPDRTLSPDDLIQLPRFDAVSAVALGDKLLAVARAGHGDDLPRGIRRALEALEEDLAALRRAGAARLASAAATDPAVVGEADRALDGCWTALYDWLTGFSKLPDGTPQAEEARELLGQLYPDGLSFILLPYELEWNQSDLRLGRIAHETLGERIRALGGAVFIDALSGAHEAYGKLLGLPRATPMDAGTPNVAVALESFVSTLRVYALKVTANVEVDEPGTAELSKRLLEPLMHWRVNPRSVLEGEPTLH